jgi:broad specificity phosphatase PhoE
MPKSTGKILILLRHAHRDKGQGREQDNGLSGKGRKQAQGILRHYERKYDSRKPHILTSARVRCVETVVPIADHTGAKVNFSGLLMEKDGEKSETGRAFRERVEKFLRWWEQDAPELTVACSHGDWIPAFLEVATGTETHLSKGGWAEIHLEDGKPRLEWLLQKLDF